MSVFRACLLTILAACVAGFVVVSIHWPLVGDAPLLHYVVFLMRHGLAPYRQIKDINMPGTYAVEALVMQWIGSGALAWRLWDFTLLFSIALSMWSICGAGNRFAALFAAMLFSLLHARDGLIQLGQRDLLLTALVLLSYALCFRIGRRADRALGWTAFSCGLALGMATTVKPQAFLLLPTMLAWLWWTERRQNRSLCLALLSAGALTPILVAAFFLKSWGAAGAFMATVNHLLPLHAAILRLPFTKLLFGAVSSVVLPMFLLWLPVHFARGAWRRGEAALLALGLLFGIGSYLLQGRGYPYHRYPSEAFLLLLLALDFEWALRSGRKLLASLAVAGLAFGTLIIAPRSFEEARSFNWKSNRFDSLLRTDLKTIGQEKLQRQVQCLDMAGGCITTLYRMQLLQSTGYLYDCYLFIPVNSPKLREDQDLYRQGFLKALVAAKPSYLIVTSDECGITQPDFTYSKLASWTQLGTFLSRDYALLYQRTPSTKESWTGKGALPYGYRIYKRLPTSAA